MNNTFLMFQASEPSMYFNLRRNGDLRGRKATGNWLCPAMHARLIYACQPVKWVRFPSYHDRNS